MGGCDARRSSSGPFFLFCREKRKMGMTPGESELFELECYRTKDKGIRESKEKQVAELLLGRLEEIQ